MLADARGQPDAATALDRLDSLLATGPGGLRNGPAVAFTLSPAFVRTVIGISPVGFEDFEGRLAALTGDRAGATRAYQHYLALRSDPEPVLRPEVEQVRAELARLLGNP